MLQCCQCGSNGPHAHAALQRCKVSAQLLLLLLLLVFLYVQHTMFDPLQRCKAAWVLPLLHHTGSLYKQPVG
jgi:hypothetical protein